jgi:hypothetical protein
MKTKVVAHIDPSICSFNLGDGIISDAVSSVISDVYPLGQIVRIPSQDSWWLGAYRVFKNSCISFVGGTNLLNSNMPAYRQWKISPKDLAFKNQIVLLGVGWWQYQGGVNRYTKFMYKNILSDSYIHSVRDEYTEKKLKSIGIDNVINTGCPTLWALDEEHCSEIPRDKADAVVFTITDYRPDESADRKLINYLLSVYESVYLWPQGHLDTSYLEKIWDGKWTGRIEVLGSSLHSFDSLLASRSEIDYVGTRLHGGIRAMQHKRRSIILEVDNRAREKAAQFGLITCPRDDIELLESLVSGKIETRILLPTDAIANWKRQFR